ncbi:MAG TPA: hypothetical protein VK892_09715 [Pyrinomonadaceae bacterium]|nr:hypothetical protein [Pyrinomonadaceae bacterium]
MSTERLILRYRGAGVAPAQDLEKIRNLSEIEIIDSSPRMLLVEGDLTKLHELLEQMPEWHLYPEKTIERPDPRYKINPKEHKN